MNKVFNDRRICNKCDKNFLLADETTENIEGQCNPEIHEETYEGIYCWECINNLEVQASHTKTQKNLDILLTSHTTHKESR